MTFRVFVQPNAELEVQKIFDWLAERSPQGALAWYEAYVVALDSLKTDPESRPTAPDGSIRGHVVRQLRFQTKRGRPYRLMYIVISVENIVRVLHVRGPGQDSVK